MRGALLSVSVLYGGVGYSEVMIVWSALSNTSYCSCVICEDQLTRRNAVEMASNVIRLRGRKREAVNEVNGR